MTPTTLDYLVGYIDGIDFMDYQIGRSSAEHRLVCLRPGPRAIPEALPGNTQANIIAALTRTALRAYASSHHNALGYDHSRPAGVGKNIDVEGHRNH